MLPVLPAIRCPAGAHAREDARRRDWRAAPCLRARGDPSHDDRPLLAVAGFLVPAYYETEHWYERHARVDAGLLAAVDELAAELEKSGPSQLDLSFVPMGHGTPLCHSPARSL